MALPPPGLSGHSTVAMLLKYCSGPLKNQWAGMDRDGLGVMTMDLEWKLALLSPSDQLRASGGTYPELYISANQATVLTMASRFLGWSATTLPSLSRSWPPWDRRAISKL